MAYMKKVPVRRAVARTRKGQPVFAQLGTVYSEMGDGAFEEMGLGLDSSGNNGHPSCQFVASNDPYRSDPTNVCTNNQGDDIQIGVSTDPITVKNLPTGTAAGAGTTGSPSTVTAALNAISSIFGAHPTPGIPQTGPSTTTIMLIGGVGLLALFLATRSKD